MTTAEDVVGFLRAHPRFLAENPELYRLLEPPVRVHGTILADHMAALLAAERAHARTMAARADDVLAAGRAAAGLAHRVQEAVLLLIAARDVTECVAAEFPMALAIDAAALCVEAAGAQGLPCGRIAELFEGRSVVFRADAAPDAMLHGAAARLAVHEALVRIPGADPPAMLALAARDAAMLDPSQGTGALGFLGRAVAAALGR